MQVLRVPTYGTSAYKYEPAEKQVKKARKGVSKRKRALSYKKNTAVIVLFTALAFILLFRYACITEMTAKLTAMKSEYDSVSSVAVARECTLQQSVDLKKVEEIATGELGMQRPEKHQIVYVNMQNTDYTEMPQRPAADGGFFAAISGGFKRLWEYFS